MAIANKKSPTPIRSRREKIILAALVSGVLLIIIGISIIAVFGRSGGGLIQGGEQLMLNIRVTGLIMFSSDNNSLIAGFVCCDSRRIRGGREDDPGIDYRVVDG